MIKAEHEISMGRIYIIWLSEYTRAFCTLPFALTHRAFNCSVRSAKNRLQYKRWCAHCNKEVSWQDTVKGIQLKDGSYFVITQENLKIEA